MRKGLLGLGICVVVLLAGCFDTPMVVPPPTQEIAPPVQEIDSGTPAPATTPSESRGLEGNGTVQPYYEVKLSDGSKVRVRMFAKDLQFNLPPGYTYTLPFEVQNLGDNSLELVAVSAYPRIGEGDALNITEGYELLENSAEMFHITPASMVLEVGERGAFQVTGDIPPNAEVPDQWEHWVGGQFTISKVDGSEQRGTIWIRCLVDSTRS